MMEKHEAVISFLMKLKDIDLSIQDTNNITPLQYGEDFIKQSPKLKKIDRKSKNNSSRG